MPICKNNLLCSFLLRLSYTHIYTCTPQSALRQGGYITARGVVGERGDCYRLKFALQYLVQANSVLCLSYSQIPQEIRRKQAFVTPWWTLSLHECSDVLLCCPLSCSLLFSSAKETAALTRYNASVLLPKISPSRVSWISHELWIEKPQLQSVLSFPTTTSFPFLLLPHPSDIAPNATWGS